MFRIFGIFQSKRQLREENERLRALLFRVPQIREVQTNIQTIQSNFATTAYEKDIVPEEVIKNKIAKEMIGYLKPFIEYDIMDNERGGKNYCGKLRIVNKK